MELREAIRESQSDTTLTVLNLWGKGIDDTGARAPRPDRCRNARDTDARRHLSKRTFFSNAMKRGSERSGSKTLSTLRLVSHCERTS